MEANIKDTVKNIFKANAFEAALELTENLRSEYIAEYGVKSWNALVAYYRKASLKHEVAQAAEPDPAYSASTKDEPSKTDNTKSREKSADVTMMNITPENVGELHNTLAGFFGEEPAPTSKESVLTAHKTVKPVSKTTLMQQYDEIKKKHPDAILLFRVGDFYETFSDDAIEASSILGITLTRRANGSAQSVELAGFPHHALDTYLPKLVRAGKRVCICEQLEDPKKYKVKEVSETVKPENPINDKQKNVTKTATDKVEDHEEKDEERVEYMLYRNTGDNVEWFGHRENFYGLKVGDTARMIRMNNKGVSQGMVVASNALTLDQVDLFHKCYGVIIRMKRSYKEQLELASKCLNKLPDATVSGKSLPSNDIKLTDYVLNFGK